MSEGFNIEQASICLASDMLRVHRASPDSHLLIVCEKAKDRDAANLTKYRVIPIEDQEIASGLNFQEPWRLQLKVSRCVKVAFVGRNNSVQVHNEFYNSAQATQEWFHYGLCRGICLIFEVKVDVQKYDQKPPDFLGRDDGS